MNTLNYIGCKHTLLPILLSICKENIGDTSMKTMSFMDLFAGTGVVGFNLCDSFKSCDANDLEYYSYIINSALLKCCYTDNIQKWIQRCNDLDVIEEGLIYRNYAPSPFTDRMFFTSENAKKADAIRQYIEKQFKEPGVMTEEEYVFLLASLLVSIDKVANTSCVYGAYLKSFKKPALKPLLLQPIHTKTSIENKEKNNVFNQTAESISITNYYDVVYMDPPYNQRQYSANYSPLNYIAKYEESIVLKGKTGLIENYNKSDFCKKTEVKKAFSALIENVKCKYLILSYNNEGLLSVDELKEILVKKGLVKLYKIQYAKFKAQKNVEKKYVEEYIWFVDTTQSGSSIIEIEID